MRALQLKLKEREAEVLEIPESTDWSGVTDPVEIGNEGSNAKAEELEENFSKERAAFMKQIKELQDFI